MGKLTSTCAAAEEACVIGPMAALASILARAVSSAVESLYGAFESIGGLHRVETDLDERTQRAFDELKQAPLVQPTRDLRHAVLEKLRALQRHADDSPG